MNTQFWDFSAPSSMFSSVQKGPFSSNVSSYFRRPSKVVKPSSRNNSPRTSSRRRMTTTGYVPARTRSVVDHQRASMPQLSSDYTVASRPISWHPNMLDEMSLLQMSNAGFMATPYSAIEPNGLVTPMSYPLQDEPQIQELITPLEGLSANEADSSYGYSQDFDMTQFWLSEQTKDSMVAFDPSLYPMMNTYQPQWYPATQYMMSSDPHTSTSPAYLPMPELGNAFDVVVPQPEEAEPESEELVAMGLYDSPADVQSSSLLFGGGLNGPVGRKTLKLEDSFEPSPNDDDDDEEEEDAVASEEDDINEPGVSPTILEQLQSNTDMAVTADYGQTMDNSYIVNQWQMPPQNSYGWI